MISASFLDESAWQVLVRSTKAFVKWLLERFGLYKKGQFWGWCRTRGEYQNLMRAAGFSQMSDGFVESPHHQRTYWIMGNGMTEA